MYWQWMIQMWDMFVALPKILSSSIQPVEILMYIKDELFSNTKLL